MKEKEGGFSLIEAMFAMGLVLTLLGLISTLMRKYSEVARHTASRDNSFDGVQFALAEMGHELGSAVEVTAIGTSLKFRRIDPLSAHLPEAPALPDSEAEPSALLTWNPRDPAHLMSVSYTKEETDALVRQAEGPSGVIRQVMVQKINGILVQQLSPDQYQLALSFQEEKRLRTFSVQARVWIAP